ncbi:MAG: YraN family protein [Rubrimonas sp.]|uniref:YraN family protein n=1 Tax=Rubrimonas sp. TaxID=2036015 RepID=UPI002FDD2524
MTSAERRGRAAHLAGLAAEEIAARLYAAEGGAVLAQRWRPDRASAREGAGEIDLVVALAGALVFVEVKAGRSAALRRDAISPRQWARLEAAAQAYMLAHQTGACPVRFDAVFIGPDGAAHRVENARIGEAW